MNYVIYSLFYINSYSGNKFKFYENNVSKVPLGGVIDTQWGGDLSKTFKSEYMCLADKESSPYATFESIEKCVEFNYNKYFEKFKWVVDNNNVSNKDLFVSGFTRTWIEQVPVDKTKNTTNLFNEFLITNKYDYDLLTEKVEKAWSSVATFISQI